MPRSLLKLAPWWRHSSPTLDGSSLVEAAQLGSPASLDGADGADGCWAASGLILARKAQRPVRLPRSRLTLWAQEERPSPSARREGLWCHSRL